MKVTLEYIAKHHQNEQVRSAISELIKFISPHYKSILELIINEILQNGAPWSKDRNVKSNKDEVRKLIDLVIKKVDKKAVDLPLVPVPAQRILKLLENPMLNIQMLTDEVGKDPVLSSKVLKIANSAM